MHVSENRHLGQLNDFDPSLFKDIICIDIEKLKDSYNVGNYKSVLPEFISTVEETFLSK